VYICFSKYGKYKQRSKFNLEQVASAAMVRGKHVQLFINRICNKRENVRFTSKKCSDFVESYICKRHMVCLVCCLTCHSLPCLSLGNFDQVRQVFGLK
jgi:hypothetical protein